MRQGQPPYRPRKQFPSEWVAAIALAALLGVGGGTFLRASEARTGAAPPVDEAIVRALGAPTGVLAVINPVNCAVTSRDVTALNALAATSGIRVTVLLLAVTPHDSSIRRVRTDFGFAPTVAVASAGSVDPRTLPGHFRMPFIAVVVRGQLRHAAWGESLKAIHAWLPRLTGVHTPSAS